MRKLITAALLMLFMSISLLADDGFIIKSYHVEVLLQEDGVIKVVEDIEVDFLERRRGIFKTIPTVYDANGDANYRVDIEDIEVSNWNYKVTNNRREKEIRIGDADRYLSGIQNYRITYRAYGAIARYEDSDEFYWNIIGPEWEVPIESASYSVRFPYGWNSQVKNYQSTSGRIGALTTLPNTLTDNLIQSSSDIRLNPGEGISVAFEIPKGLLPAELRTHTGSSEESKGLRPQPNKWLSLIPAGLAALLFGQWRQRGKRQPELTEIEDQYYPPEGMSPAQVGTFYDYKVNRRDIISLLPYWGDRGYIKMRQLEEDVYFEKISELPATEPAYAQVLFDELFEQSDNTMLSSLQEKMYRTMSSVASKIKKEVKAKELYDDKAIKTFHSGRMILLGALCIALAIFLMISLEAFFLGIGFIVLGIFSICTHFFQPKLSNKGYTVHNHLKGLYNFLKNPEPAQLATLTAENPSYLSQLFPYAMAFGLDKEWESYFQERDDAIPDWYIYNSSMVHGGQANFGSFAKSFNPRSIEKVFYSAPASQNSSGGGFSGGGSVGGGFGGGGGGSW